MSNVMTKLSKSADRFTFQKNSYLKRKAEQGKTPETDDEVSSMLDFLNLSRNLVEEREQKPEWRENNMEHDLRTTDWILEKVRTDETYAQNLYAAMCNNDFKKILDENNPETIDKILREDIPQWSCSWRYAGGIIADMREEGDYIDWYCSGIRDHDPTAEPVNGRLFVSESVVTDEIRDDILRLGWRIIQDD